MSLYLGIPTNNRLASKEFSSIGINYRKADRISQLGLYASAPLLSLSMAGFMSLVPYAIASKSLGIPIPLGSRSLIKVNTLPFFQDALIPFSMVTTAALSDTKKTELELVTKNPGGQYQNGYIGSRKFRMSEIANIVSSVGKTKIHMANGVSGIGLCPEAVIALMTLSRLSLGYLESQVGEEGFVNTPNQEVGSNWISNWENKEDDTLEDGSINDENEEISWKKATLKALGVTEGVMGVISCGGPGAKVLLSLDDVPEVAGHPVSFVPYALPSDPDFVEALLHDHFAALLGPDMNTIRGSINMIVRHLPSICRTIPGQAVMHLLLCISIGIKTSGFVVAVMDKGTTLLGCIIQTSMSIVIGGNVVAPVLAESVPSTVKSWMTQEKARAEVAVFLSSLVSAATGKKLKQIDASGIATFADLVVAIQQRVRPTILSDSLKTCLHFLRYDYTPLAATAENITNMLIRIAEDKMPENAVVHEELFLNSDTCLVANLSVFGTSSVSFVNPSGKRIDLWKVKSDDPQQKKKKKVQVQKPKLGKKGKRMFDTIEEEVFFWDRLCVSRPDIGTAVKDFDVVRSTHRIFQLSLYDTKLLGSVDVHPIKDGGNELLDALRNFGGTALDFSVAKRRKVFVEAEEIGEDVEVDGEEAEELGLDF